jgi:hypothetical protein
MEERLMPQKTKGGWFTKSKQATSQPPTVIDVGHRDVIREIFAGLQESSCGLTITISSNDPLRQAVVRLTNAQATKTEEEAKGIRTDTENKRGLRVLLGIVAVPLVLLLIRIVSRF